MRRRFVVVSRDSTNNPYRPSSGVCVKKRHGYRCSGGSDYKPVAVARYINLARKLCLSLSLFFWQVASTFILSPVLVGMRGLQEARVRFLAARACFYKWTSILSFFFSFFLSLPASGNVYKDETNAVTSLLETVAPVLWLFCYEQGNE